MRELRRRAVLQVDEVTGYTHEAVTRCGNVMRGSGARACVPKALSESICIGCAGRHNWALGDPGIPERKDCI